MSYRHFLLSGSLAITSFATVALVSPAARAANLVTSLPIEFVTTSGGFIALPPSPNPSAGINANIVGVGAGSTIPFNPTTGGAILANFVAANVTGSFVYTGAAGNDFLFFDLLSNGVSVFSQLLASGDIPLQNSFDIDLSGLVPTFANTDLAIQFSGGILTGDSQLRDVKLLITTVIVPEPGTVAGLGLLGAGLAVSSVRKKFRRDTKTKV